MTVGEKIQFYRKKIGLSQEELGQKLLVSRQTVSLWEMDKTLPTIDNLLRLKEIFSTSIDDILSESNPAEEKKEALKESYLFQYSKSELRDVFKHSIFPIIQRLAIFSVACIVIFIIFAANNAPDTIIGLILGYFLIGILSYIKGIFAYKKSWNDGEKRIFESTYLYEIYDQYFVLNVSKNEEVIRTFKIYFEDIEKIQAFGNYLILQIAGQSYIIKKDALSEDSRFYLYCNRNPEKIETKKAKDPLKAVSVWLFVCSIATIFGAQISVAILSEINKMFSENMWLFFLFTPIPIASIIFGVYLKKKGYKYKKNIIVGIIMTALLCIYGSFSFIFADVYSHSEEPILKIEETLSIDIPAHSQINTQDWTKGTQSLPRGYIFSTSDVFFDENAVKEFERKLSNDNKWISAVSSDMIGITSYFCDIQNYDYIIIYNIDTKEFNKLPSETGKYKFINVLYNSENNTMKLVEYEIEYAK